MFRRRLPLVALLAAGFVPPTHAPQVWIGFSSGVTPGQY